MSILNFNAKQARDIIDYDSEEIRSILGNIKILSENNRREYLVTFVLSEKTLDCLIEKGFTVKHDIENNYHSIEW